MFPQKLKFLREAKNLSQAKMAEDLGMKQSVISNYENAVREPNITNLLHIADYFEVTMDELLDRNNDNPKYHLRELSKGYYYPSEISSIIPFAFNKNGVSDYFKKDSIVEAYVFKSINYLFLIVNKYNKSHYLCLNIFLVFQEICLFIYKNVGVLRSAAENLNLNEEEKKELHNKADQELVSIYHRIRSIMFLSMNDESY